MTPGAEDPGSKTVEAVPASTPVDTCRARLPELAELLRSHLACEVRLVAAEPQPFAAGPHSDRFAGRGGLAVTIEAGPQRLFCLVPEELLPAWARGSESDSAGRLEAFARGLSLHVLPAETLIDATRAAFAPDLQAFLQQSAIDPAAVVLEIETSPIAAESGEKSGEPAVDAEAASPPPAPSSTPAAPAAVYVIAPPTIAAIMSVGPNALETAETREASAVNEAGAERESPESAAAATSDSSRDDVRLRSEAALRALRILSVPVTVSVRLAERKLALGQIVGLMPGTLVTFNKSCEELLDLFVNNHCYCRGEAVKIGENFGLKVVEVGVMDVRKEHVL
jgi:flagellar motor switch protein FliN/FliY